jgi:outer membrane murein-binding lipoprotein Lpp
MEVYQMILAVFAILFIAQMIITGISSRRLYFSDEKVADMSSTICHLEVENEQLSSKVKKLQEQIDLWEDDAIVLDMRDGGFVTLDHKDGDGLHWHREKGHFVFSDSQDRIVASVCKDDIIGIFDNRKQNTI